MKVLLISANTLTSPYPVYPLGLDYVSNALSPRHEVEIADMNVLKETMALQYTIKQFAPDIVGISVRNIDSTDASAPCGFSDNYAEIARAVRQASDAVLVLGGCGFTIFPREMMALLKADYGICGEGERLVLFLDALEKKEDLTRIPGLVTIGAPKPPPSPWEGVLKRSRPTAGKNLDFYLKNGGMLNLQTKRGCCFRCVYCTYPHIEGHRLRLIPPEEVAETAFWLQQAGAKYFFITDSAFNVDIEHSLMVAEAFMKKEISIPWGAFFAPVPLPVDYFKTMADAGLRHVEFGTESLCDSVLLAYQKPFQAAHVFRAHQEAVNAGLYVAHYFLLGGPGENPQSMKQTFSRIDKLKKTVLFFFPGMRIYPHTDLFRIAVEEKKIEPSQKLLEQVFYEPDSISLTEIAEKIAERAESRPNWIAGAGGEQAASIVSRMYKRGFSGPLWEYLIR
jgi:radical SAM superfamily enzyme YgiQ (UPF0313 family)